MWKMKTYYVYGDLTPFFDRWRSQHTRLIYVGIKPLAITKAHIHVALHPHGRAFLSEKELTEVELGNVEE